MEEETIFSTCYGKTDYKRYAKPKQPNTATQSQRVEARSIIKSEAKGFWFLRGRDKGVSDQGLSSWLFKD
jgi:hypothetical protein